MEDREIKFWISHPEWEPPYTKECDMDWEAIKADYIERTETEKRLGIDRVRETYQTAVENITQAEIEAFLDGKLPKALVPIVELDPGSTNFVAKGHPEVVIGNINDILQNYTYGESDE